MSEIKRLLNSLLWDIYGCIPFNVNRKISRTRQMKMLPTLYEPLLLEKLSSKVLNDICETLKVEIRLISKYLERVLISRDKNRTQQNILYGFLDVIVSSRLGESSREMRFSLSPSPPQGATKGRGDPGRPIDTEETTSSSDFNQWLHAMKLVARLPGGMPPEFRRKLWLALAEKYLKSKNVDWGREEVKCFSEQWREDDEELGIQIVKDLHRTGSSLCSGPAGTINQAKLKRILLGYARYNPEVGYCQGFNMLGALILQVMDKEEIESIKVMIYLVEGILPSGYFSGSLGGLQADMAVFRELMTCKLPRLAKHLQKLQGPVENAFEPPLTNVFTMQWFLTMFCTCLPMTCVLRVWDLVLIEGSDVLLRTALVLWSLLEERILNARTADDFYCKMGSFSSELLNGHLIDSNGLIEKVVDLGPVPELQKLRDKHLYNISPFRDKKGLQLYYSDEEGDSDEDSRMAVATAWGLRLTRRGSAGLSNRTDSKDRIALDISLLKKQYDRLRERQRQAHIILTSAVARQGSNPNQSTIQMNQLLMGRNAIVTNNGRRLGPPQGAIPPARKVSLPTAKSPKMAQGKSLRRGETLHWRDTDLSKRRRGSLKWKDIKSDSSQSGQDDRTAQLVESEPSSRSSSSEPKSQRTSLKASRQRSDSSSYSEDSDGNSSTSTSLCDEDDHEVCEINASSLEGSPLKKSKSSKKHSEVPHKKCLEDVLNSNEKQHGTDCQIPFIQLSTMDSPVPQTNKTDNDSLENEKEDSGTESNRLDYAGFVDEFSWPDMKETSNRVPFEDITIDGTSDEGDFLSLSNIITSTSQLSPLPDITTYINNSSISPLRTPISAFDYANLLVSMDDSKNFDVNDEGVTNEYFERINIVERPTKLDLLYSLNEEDNIRNAFKTPSCQPTPEELFVEDVAVKEHACSSEVPNIQNDKTIQHSAEEMDRKMKVLLEYSNQSSLSFIAEAKHEICSGLFKTKEFDTESLKYQSSALIPMNATSGAVKSKTDESFEHIYTVPSVTTIYKTALTSNKENNEKSFGEYFEPQNSALEEKSMKTQCQSPSKSQIEVTNYLRLVENTPHKKEDASTCKCPAKSKDDQQTPESFSGINQRDLDSIPTTEDLETRFRALEMTFTAGKSSTIIETSSEYKDKTGTCNENILETGDLKTTKTVENQTSGTSPSKEKVLNLIKEVPPELPCTLLPEDKNSTKSDAQKYVPYTQHKQLDTQDSTIPTPNAPSTKDGVNFSLMKQSIGDFDLAAKNTPTPESLIEEPELDHLGEKGPKELTVESEPKQLDYESSLSYSQNHFDVDIDPKSYRERVPLSDEQVGVTKSEGIRFPENTIQINCEPTVSKDSGHSCHYDVAKRMTIESTSDTTPDYHINDSVHKERSTLMLLSYSENHFGEKNISQSKFVSSFTNSEFLFKTKTNSEKPKRHSFHDYDKLDQSKGSNSICHETKTNLIEDSMTSKDAVELSNRRKPNIPSTEDLESRFMALERQFSDKSLALTKDNTDSVSITFHSDLQKGSVSTEDVIVKMEKSGTTSDSSDEVKAKESCSQAIREETKPIPSTADLEQRFRELERQLSASNLNQVKKTTDTIEEYSKALKQSNNIVNPSIVFTNNEDPKPINATKVVRKTIKETEDEPPFIRKRIPSTEDLETRFEALEIQKSLRSPTNLLSPSKMTEFLNCVPELETVAKRKSDIPSTEDLESRFKALEQNKLTQKASNGTPNKKPNSDTTIPSTKDLESRFEALEQRKAAAEESAKSDEGNDSSAISDKTTKMESKKVPSTEDLEIRFNTLEQQKSLKTNDVNIVKTDVETSENKTKSRGLEQKQVPTIEDLEIRYEALEQKKAVTEKLADENSTLRKEEQKTHFSTTPDEEIISKAKEQIIATSDETGKEKLQSDQNFETESDGLQPQVPESGASLQKAHPSSVDSCSMPLSVQVELKSKLLTKNLEKEQKTLSKVPSTHDLERRFNKLQIDTKMSKTIKGDDEHGPEPTTITSNTKTTPKRKDLYKIESQSDETLTSTDQTSIEFESKSESRPTSCPEYRDPFDSNNGTTDMVLKIIEENSKILHRILKKTLADSVESGAEADAQSKKSHSGITDSLLALGNIFPGTDEVSSPSRLKSHSWIRSPIALRSDDNISDRLASIKSTIKSIDTLCEEKSFHKEKCQRYIDSLFARPTKPTVTAPNPLIKVDNLECKQSQEHVTKRELKKDTSPRRRRDEDREEKESRVRRNLMPNSIETPSDHSFSLENTEHVDSEVDRIIHEKQTDAQLERLSSPYSVSGYDVNKRSITPVVYIPTKLEIRHTTVTSTFYDRYLTEKHIERTFPRSKKSPISPQATKSFLDIAGYSPINLNDRNSKSAENSPSRRKDTNELAAHEKLAAATNKRSLMSTLDVAQKDLHIRSCDNILLQLRSSTNNKDILPSIMVYNPLPTKIRKPPELGISLGMYKDYGTDESSKS